LSCLLRRRRGSRWCSRGREVRDCDCD
jgi:hypothetical protein